MHDGQRSQRSRRLLHAGLDGKLLTLPSYPLCNESRLTIFACKRKIQRNRGASAQRATTITTTGNVTAANSVPSATAPDTGFTSR